MALEGGKIGSISCEVLWVCGFVGTHRLPLRGYSAFCFGVACRVPSSKVIKVGLQTVCVATKDFEYG